MKVSFCGTFIETLVQGKESVRAYKRKRACISSHPIHDSALPMPVLGLKS